MGETVRIQDDLYHAINGEWLKTAIIPDDKPMTGGFNTLAEDVEKTMMADFKAYFENWGRIWCMKAKEEMIQLLLARDVHAPAPIRANIPPRNFSEWYEAFGVTDKDKMYIAPNKRISIW